VDLDLTHDALGTGADGKPVYLGDIWPGQKEIQAAIQGAVTAELFKASYADVFKGDERWRAIEVPESRTYRWDGASTYIQNPPYFAGMQHALPGLPAIRGARCLAVFGDSITTDHISPAGSIRKDSPAGKYLVANGVQPADFNSYGSRRGNHEVMMRGTFANVRIRNRMTPEVEGGVTRLQPGGEQLPIYDAAMRYVAAGTPLVILAGREYGTGSSRDWAAKGTRLLGVRAVIAVSFERIHRANLVGMGVFPLTFREGQDAASLGLDGTELFEFEGLVDGARSARVSAARPDGRVIAFEVAVRVDTPKEWEYMHHGGILQYVLRQLLG
jgi:aconitate hydratase